MGNGYDRPPAWMRSSGDDVPDIVARPAATEGGTGPMPVVIGGVAGLAAAYVLWHLVGYAQAGRILESVGLMFTESGDEATDFPWWIDSWIAGPLDWVVAIIGGAFVAVSVWSLIDRFVR